MGQLRWYKRDPLAALEGMSALTLEERGAYNTILDLIYAHDGFIDDDDHFIAGWLRVDVRVWKRIRKRLVGTADEQKKLYVTNGTIRNSRADVEVLRGLSRVASAKEAGLTSARIRNAGVNTNNDLASTTVPTTVPTNKNLEVDKEKKESQKERSPALPATPSRPAYAFECGIIRLNERDLNRWRKAYHRLDLESELLALERWAAARPDQWFYAVQAALRKKNAAARLDEIKHANGHDDDGHEYNSNKRGDDWG